MSLRTNTDVCALSLGVELNEDGSIVVDSIEVTQSRIRVTYRLSYDDVDDMLMEGVAYQEEFQLGILMNAATSRRKYREGRGSVEAMIPNPIPQSFVSIYDDMMEKDGIGIRISVGASNNSGQNRTSFTDGSDSPDEAENLVTVSDSNLLVTEMMILAGEALGKWKLRPEPPTFCGRFENTLTLPFRSQPKPDYRSNEKEYKILTGLLEYNKGGGYCHAWYARRFLSPVKIGPEAKPHSGLGVDCYVQWTSPIRRFGDLQVHAAVKRFLRRKRIHDIIFAGESIPLELNQIDLGCPVPDSTNDVGDYMFTVDADIDYDWGSALLKASRVVNRQSQQYWLFEYLSRKIALGDPPSFNAIVLGCVDPERKQYAVYLPEIGFEHRYLSQKGYLQAGEVVVLKIQSVSARLGLLTLTP
jgi:exoribonuclease-2